MKQCWYIHEDAVPSPEELIEIYPVDPGPLVRANMVTSLDGQAAIDGRSKGLSTQLDRQIFHFLRATSQVILVGAGTARLENYQAARLTPELAQFRVRIGIKTPLRIVVASRTASPSSEESATSDRHAQEDGAIATHSLPSPLDLAALGASIGYDPAQPGGILCEGGPSLLNSLLSYDLVSELCLTVRHLVAGPSSVPLASSNLDQPVDFRLGASIASSTATFLRLTRRPD